MHWLTSPDTSGPEEVRVSVRACRELRTIPGVRNCGSHIGQALLSDEPYGIYFGENWISVDPAVDYDETLASVQEVVDGYPGIRRDVQTYLKERIREVLTGSSDAVVVRIYGDDLHVLESKAEEVRQVMEGVDGLVEAKVELHQDVPQVEVEVDLPIAQEYGVKPGDVRRASATLIASEEVGDIFFGGKAYDVHVWSSPETRNSLTSIQELPIDTPDGGQVRLAQVADVRIAPTPNTIERENLSRRLEVSANVSGRDLGSVVDDPRRPPRGDRLPARLQRRAARRVRGATVCAAAHAHPRDRRRDRSLPAPAGLVRELAACDAVLPDAADGARRRGAGGLPGRRRALARLAGRLLHGLRHRRAQRDPDDQPLPASGAVRGRNVRASARPARSAGAALADPDDDAGDGPRDRAPRDRRRHSRARDRASAGGRGHRRPRHLDAAQPVRRSLALPPLREAAADRRAPTRSGARRSGRAGRHGAPGSSRRRGRHRARRRARRTGTGC